MLKSPFTVKDLLDAVKQLGMASDIPSVLTYNDLTDAPGPFAWVEQGSTGGVEEEAEQPDLCVRRPDGTWAHGLAAEVNTSESPGGGGEGVPVVNAYADLDALDAPEGSIAVVLKESASQGWGPARFDPPVGNSGNALGVLESPTTMRMADTPIAPNLPIDSAMVVTLAGESGETWVIDMSAYGEPVPFILVETQPEGMVFVYVLDVARTSSEFGGIDVSFGWNELDLEPSPSLVPSSANAVGTITAVRAFNDGTPLDGAFSRLVEVFGVVIHRAGLYVKLGGTWRFAGT